MFFYSTKNTRFHSLFFWLNLFLGQREHEKNGKGKTVNGKCLKSSASLIMKRKNLQSSIVLYAWELVPLRPRSEDTSPNLGEELIHPHRHLKSIFRVYHLNMNF
jgi:hypothetical protein